MAKTIKVLIEIPEKWIDLDNSPLGWVSTTVRDMVKQQLKEQIIEYYISRMDTPEIKVSKEEVKMRIIDKLAERALENYGTKD